MKSRDKRGELIFLDVLQFVDEDCEGG